MRPFTTIGIDLGTTKIRVVVLYHDPKKNEEYILANTSIETKGMHRGYIRNHEETLKTLKKVVRESEKMAGIPIRTALLGIHPSTLTSVTSVGSTIISKADAEITELDVEKAMKEAEDAATFANRKILYRDVIEYKIDGKIVPGKPEGMRGAKLEIKGIFLSVLSQHLEDIEALFLEAGIDILDIMPSILGGEDIVLTDRQKLVGSIVIDIGGDTTSLAVYENMHLLGVHTIAIGSNDVTNDIALGLKISLEEAEEIKRGGGIRIFPKKKLDDIIEARLYEIFEIIENYLKKIKKNQLLPAGVILLGGGVEIQNIEMVAKESLNLPVKVAQLEIDTKSKGGIRDISWISAYGLAQKATAFEQNENGSFRSFIKKIKKQTGLFFKQFMP